MKRQNGFIVTELLIAVAGLAIMVLIIWVIIHFVVKFW